MSIQICMLRWIDKKKVNRGAFLPLCGHLKGVNNENVRNNQAMRHPQPYAHLVLHQA